MCVSGPSARRATNLSLCIHCATCGSLAVRQKTRQNETEFCELISTVRCAGETDSVLVPYSPQILFQLSEYVKFHKPTRAILIREDP